MSFHKPFVFTLTNERQNSSVVYHSNIPLSSGAFNVSELKSVSFFKCSKILNGRPKYCHLFDGFILVFKTNNCCLLAATALQT